MKFVTLQTVIYNKIYYGWIIGKHIIFFKK